ncbi:response regulator [Flavobacterium pallidum]|uniref:Response regulator n=1 Tax=Flavobacterium pallidum TaxID=2172098 RepID=A0A2S1SKK4_9FLAO|nr:response regulator [Flavobacterium pallidum]AWI26943.1 response regulator [Flavobacterium pallidum]
MTIFLTDDDSDDCMLFSEALRESHSDVSLNVTTDGVKLMEMLHEMPPSPPMVLFLDLNMPRKNGFECLDEIRKSPNLKDIPIIIFSTSSNTDIIDRTYSQGANYFISKPNSFVLLKKAIEHILSFDSTQLNKKPLREKYVINVA